MVFTWIAVTVLLAAVVGTIGAGLSDRYDRGVGFFIGVVLTFQFSLAAALIYVVTHFISKYW